ncbi:MAG TPA: hypothetical protein VLI72_03380 [Methylibium sp.]|nr:hypothetical protein [Methylibium sp.]
MWHVLREVDAQQDSQCGRAVADWSASLAARKPEPHIYWSFICKERNSILKKYKTSATQSEIDRESFSRPKINPVTRQLHVEQLEPIYLYTITTGPFAGRDQRDLIHEAIRWWESQLDDIDAAVRAAQLTSTSRT